MLFGTDEFEFDKKKDSLGSTRSISPSMTKDLPISLNRHTKKNVSTFTKAGDREVTLKIIDDKASLCEIEVATASNKFLNSMSS